MAARSDLCSHCIYFSSQGRLQQTQHCCHHLFLLFLPPFPPPHSLRISKKRFFVGIWDPGFGFMSERAKVLLKGCILHKLISQSEGIRLFFAKSRVQFFAFNSFFKCFLTGKEDKGKLRGLIERVLPYGRGVVCRALPPWSTTVLWYEFTGPALIVRIKFDSHILDSGCQFLAGPDQVGGNHKKQFMCSEISNSDTC